MIITWQTYYAARILYIKLCEFLQVCEWHKSLLDRFDPLASDEPAMFQLYISRANHNQDTVTLDWEKLASS